MYRCDQLACKLSIYRHVAEKTFKVCIAGLYDDREVVLTDKADISYLSLLKHASREPLAYTAFETTDVETWRPQSTLSGFSSETQ